MSTDTNKSEKATPHKLKEAHKKGQVTKSTEITSFFMLLIFLIMSYFMLENIANGIMNFSEKLLMSSGKVNLSVNNIHILFFDVVRNVTILLLPLVVVLILAAILFNVVQTGLVLSSHPITPDWKRLDPVKGLKKIFSKKIIFELFKALLKVGIIYSLWYFLAEDWLGKLIATYGMSVKQFTQFWTSSAFSLVVLLLLIFLPLALLDISFNKWDFLQQMRMSTQDVKDEHKKREGDPQIKQKQKKIQKEMLEKSASLKTVKNSDVIFVNPEHLAVALKYSPKDMLAPKILSMGEDKNAQKIRSIARSHGIPIIRNISLTRKIYANSAINGYVPESCYDELAPIFRIILNKNKH
jgi:flagellar biosynthesis protein FlhB